MIESKPSVYKGIEFRSKLEISWYKYFSMFAHIEYERHIPGIYYLPDFYLPKYNTYIEIKPKRELTEEEKDKAIRLYKATEAKVYIICGKLNNNIVYTVPSFSKRQREYLLPSGMKANTLTFHKKPKKILAKIDY
jgi:hypothetical protein